MCANYWPVTRLDRLLTFFGIERDRHDMPPDLEVWPLGLAPFIRAAEDGTGRRAIVTGQFGLLPFFAKEVAYGRRTYNARSETVATLPSFRDAWKHGQRCIVPAECIFEACWETGRAVRWRIEQPGEVPLGIAGIYRCWRAPDGSERWTFAMLTVSGAGHAIFERMHRPGDEKRMVAILDPSEYDRWLQCPPAEAMTMLVQWPGALVAAPAPLPPRRAAGRKPKPPGDAVELFNR
jgi:putative SOS response-associated peptidase YedK